MTVFLMHCLYGNRTSGVRMITELSLSGYRIDQRRRAFEQIEDIFERFIRKRSRVHIVFQLVVFKADRY